MTAQDGESSQTYTVTVTRAGSADATLNGLSLMGDGGEVVALSPVHLRRGLRFTRRLLAMT